MNYIVLAILGLGLVSCATLNEEQCREGDWYGRGLKNGKEGKNLLKAHVKACAEYGITPDSNQYNKGIMEGVKSYCTPENGYRTAIAGNTYAGVCPKPMESAFIKKYRIGKKIYDIKRQFDSNKAEIKRLESQLSIYSGDTQGRRTLEKQIYEKRRDNRILNKKLIFLRAQSGYDLEDIVDHF